MISIEESVQYIRENAVSSALQQYKFKLLDIYGNEIISREPKNDFDRGYIQGLLYANSVIRRDKP